MFSDKHVHTKIDHSSKIVKNRDQLKQNLWNVVYQRPDAVYRKSPPLYEERRNKKRHVARCIVGHSHGEWFLTNRLLDSARVGSDACPGEKVQDGIDGQDEGEGYRGKADVGNHSLNTVKVATENVHVSLLTSLYAMMKYQI